MKHLKLRSDWVNEIPNSVSLLDDPNHIFLLNEHLTDDMFWTNISLVCQYDDMKDGFIDGLKWSDRRIPSSILQKYIPNLTDHQIDWLTIEVGDNEVVVIAHAIVQSNTTLSICVAVLATSNFGIAKLKLAGELLLRKD